MDLPHLVGMRAWREPDEEMMVVSRLEGHGVLEAGASGQKRPGRKDLRPEVSKVILGTQQAMRFVQYVENR